MSLSPTCTINGGSTPADVTTNTTINGALANAAGVAFFAIKAIGSDDVTGTAGLATLNGTLVVNQTNKTFSFTSPPNAGTAIIFQVTVGVSPQSTLGSGRDVNGNIVPAWTTTFKVNIPTGTGQRVVAQNEVTEQDPNVGWLQPINAAIRVAGTGGSGGGGTTTTSNFTQPAVGSTVVVPMADATAAVVGKGAEIAGGGFYTVTHISGLNVTLLNGTSAVNASPTSVINSGAVVTFGGLGAPQAGGTLNGQVQQLVAGTFSGTGHHPVVNVLSYGADPTGVASSSLAVQAAIDSACTLGTAGAPCVVYFPIGLYLIDIPVVVWAGNVILRGDGAAEYSGTSGLSPVGSVIASPFESNPLFVWMATGFEATYQVDSGITTLSMQKQLSSTLETQCIVMSESDIGCIHGLSAFKMEFFVDLQGTWGSTNDPSVLIASGGSMRSDAADFASAITVLIDDTVGGGSPQVHTTLTTSSGAVSNTSGNLNASGMNYIAIEFDGTHLKTYTGASSGTATATGTTGSTTPGSTVVQQPYETLAIGIRFLSYPTAATSQTISVNHPYHLGPYRISTAAPDIGGGSFTIPSLPLALAGSGQTVIVQDMVATSRGANFNARLTGYLVGSTNYQNNAGSFIRPTTTVYMRVRGLIGASYLNHIKCEGLSFYGLQEGIYTFAATYHHIYRCLFSGYRGITLDQFSYEGCVEKCIFQGLSFNAHNGWLWGMYVGPGTQFERVIGNTFEAGSVGYQFCIESACGGYFEGNYMVGGQMGFFYHNGISGFGLTLTLVECFGYDDGSPVGVCGYWIGTVLSNLSIVGGQCVCLLSGSSVGPSIVYDDVHHGRIDVQLQSAGNSYGLFKFPTVSANPLLYTGNPSFGTSPIVDPAGSWSPILQPDREPVAVTVDTTAMTSHSGGLLMATNDFLSGGRIQITGALSGDTTIFLPAINSCYTRWFQDATTGGHQLTFQGLTGTGVQLGSLKKACLAADGTNWVRETGDV